MQLSTDLIDALCSGEEDDSDVVCSVNVRNIIAGDEVSDEQLITIELGEPLDLSAYQ